MTSLLMADDRVARNREDLKVTLRSHLEFVIAECEEAIEVLEVGRNR